MNSVRFHDSWLILPRLAPAPTKLQVTCQSPQKQLQTGKLHLPLAKDKESMFSTISSKLAWAPVHTQLIRLIGSLKACTCPDRVCAIMLICLLTVDPSVIITILRRRWAENRLLGNPHPGLVNTSRRDHRSRRNLSLASRTSALWLSVLEPLRLVPTSAQANTKLTKRRGQIC